MNLKSIVLFVASCFIILLIYSTNFYGIWFDNTIAIVKEEVPLGIGMLGTNDRNLIRFGETYGTMVAAVQYIRSVMDSDKVRFNKPPLVLLPPVRYMRDNGSKIFIPEPVVFYYYTGVKAVWTTSSNVRDADWVIMMADNHAICTHIASKQQMDSVLALFKGYTPTL